MNALRQYQRIQREAEMERSARIQRALDRDAELDRSAHDEDDGMNLCDYAELDRARLEQPHSEDAEYAALLYTLYGVACFIGLVMVVAIVWSGWGR